MHVQTWEVAKLTVFSEIAQRKKSFFQEFVKMIWSQA